jgi:hypothetical protein
MPHTTEIFYKMACRWAEDPKVATLARFGAVDACLGRDLFGQMIDYARRELTDGLVPGEVIAHCAYPLPADDAMRIAMQLADPGAYGPLCDWDAARNAFRILAYGKWNDTRAEVDARRDVGRNAALHRWKAPAGTDANGNANSNARSGQAGQITAKTLASVRASHARGGVEAVMSDLGYSARNARRLVARARAELGKADTP